MYRPRYLTVLQYQTAYLGMILPREYDSAKLVRLQGLDPGRSCKGIVD
jgi:hypothetical protein